MRACLGIALVFAVLAAAACSRHDGVRIGAKPFVEQDILAEILEAVLAEEAIATRPVHVCRDTFDCMRELQGGYLDLMVEYSGTAMQLLGDAEFDDTDLYTHVAQRYAAKGIRWHARLGFDNGYVWLAASSRARQSGWAALSNLANEEPLRVACPPEYVRRPRDGLLATAERYGIKLHAEPLIMRDPIARYKALLSGQADVAVGYTTDGNLDDWGLDTLADDLEFFPPYDAAILVRQDALDAEPQLGEALLRLDGALDNATMRRLNHAATIDGEPVEQVARGFLRRRGLVTTQDEHKHSAPLKIAYSAQDTKRHFGAVSLAAVREVFEGRSAQLEHYKDPARAVATGQARLALIGAEAFFDRRGRRRDDIEAVAVLGRRAVHVVAHPGTPAPLGGRVGIPPPGRGGQLAASLLTGLGGAPARTDELDSLIAAVADGTLDAAVVIAPVGDPEIDVALSRTDLALVSRQRWAGGAPPVALPYLRPSTIREGTYAGRDDPVETLAAQVLLAGPSRRGGGPIRAGGPVGAVPTAGVPLELKQAEELARVIGVPEAPDPALPSAWSLSAAPHADDHASAWAETFLNMFVIGFLAWLFSIVVAPVRRETVN